MEFWARPPRPREQENLGPCCRLLRRCLINRLLFVGANNRRRGSAPNSRSLDGQACEHTMGCSAMFARYVV
ncbi:hypothetical protein EVAR_34178_1 [Eumeta japonica]|uniref:Uncharacterized protein n=1 Tax=Eumeta variegata TaxID=151549 RepID=A0A4C1WII7_EUMVA|nr:hypothetical protein EVAR_34178_1 [Eumeta japonica]